MSETISTVVANAISTREWWDTAADGAAIAVAIGVILDAAKEFKVIAWLFGISTKDRWRKMVARSGELLLIVAAVVGVLIGWKIGAATGIIETNLTRGMNSAIAANEKLNHRLRQEEGRLKVAQSAIVQLEAKEVALRIGLAEDEAVLGAQARYLAGRLVTKRQFSAIQSLKGKTSDILILTESHCPECINYSAQIADAFTKANIAAHAQFLDVLQGTGDGCVYETSPNAKVVYDALHKAGFTFKMCSWPQSFGSATSIPTILILEQSGFPHSRKPYSKSIVITRGKK